MLILAATALYQGWVLSGGWAGLAGTGFGWMELAKLALFLALLACAAVNRFSSTPALAGADPARGRRALGRGIAVETAFGLLIVFAAAVLTSLEPGMHVQPVWPFPMRPSLTIVDADPGFRREVADAVLAVLGALALVGLGIVVRWIRWIAWLAAAVIAWFAVPHFDLLFVEAYPTSFYHSPTGFAATAIADGAALYPQHCASCHGAEGRGDGPAARGLRIPPADLTAEHLWAHSDGELFWWLSHGIVSAEGEVAMPGFSGTLSDRQIWHLIDYVRANNAGITQRTTGAWTPPMQAPALNATCAGGQAVTLAGLRGRVVRVVFGPGAPPSLPPDAPAATILLAPQDVPRPKETASRKTPPWAAPTQSWRVCPTAATRHGNPDRREWLAPRGPRAGRPGRACGGDQAFGAGAAAAECGRHGVYASPLKLDTIPRPAARTSNAWPRFSERIVSRAAPCKGVGRGV